MGRGAQSKPRVRADVIVERLPGETLVYDESRDIAHCLSDAAAAVFELCDGTRTKPALAPLAAQRLGRRLDQAELDAVLGELRSKALLAEDAPAGGVSRRQVVLAGGGAAAAALITTIVAPLPAAAQSAAPPVECTSAEDCNQGFECQSNSCCVPEDDRNCTVGGDDCCGDSVCVDTEPSPVCRGPSA
jgi:hypothetical protein